MTNSYFDEPGPPVEHPRIRAWNAYLSRVGRDGHAEVDVRRRREAFGFGPAKLFVTFYTADGKVDRVEEAEWEEELDAWLVQHGVTAKPRESEVLRTALRLGDRLYKLLFKYGDGYFNALVLHVVAKGPLGQDESVRKVLDHVHRDAPYDGGSLAERIGEVEGVFKGLARELTAGLRYDRPIAERILADAVAQYLDERFHVAERLRLFGR